MNSKSGHTHLSPLFLFSSFLYFLFFTFSSLCLFSLSSFSLSSSLFALSLFYVLFSVSLSLVVLMHFSSLFFTLFRFSFCCVCGKLQASSASILSQRNPQQCLDSQLKQLQECEGEKHISVASNESTLPGNYPNYRKLQMCAARWMPQRRSFCLSGIRERGERDRVPGSILLVELLPSHFCLVRDTTAEDQSNKHENDPT